MEEDILTLPFQESFKKSHTWLHQVETLNSFKDPLDVNHQSANYLEHHMEHS